MKESKASKFTLLLVLVGAFSVAESGFAHTLSSVEAMDLRKRFESFQRATRFWSAQFSQSLSIPGLKAPVVSEGTIRFRSPDSLRIDFDSPAGEWILATGEKLLMQKPGKALVQKPLQSNAAGKPLQGLMSLLRGSPDQEADWFSPEVSRQGESYQIELLRKEGAPSHLPKRVVNTVKADSLSVQRVSIHLPNGAVLSYVFGSVERNRSIDASVFEHPSTP